MSESELVFGRYRIEFSVNQLILDGHRVSIPPLIFRLLAYLALNRARTVSKQELITELWDGVRVSESSLTQAIKQARRAVGDSGRAQAVIQTTRGFGYRFVAEIPESAEAIEPPASSSGTFVGRTHSLDTLEAILARTITGRGNLLLLSGEPGIGKTRLCDEFARRAARRGVLVARGAAIAQAGMPSYWPWIRIFRDLSQVRPTRQLLEELRTLAPSFVDPVSADPLDRDRSAHEAARFRVFDAVNQCLQRAASIGPIVLILDDLHEASASTIELLEFIASEIDSTALMIIAAYRPAESLRNRALANVLARIDRQPSVERHALTPLGSEDLVRLVVLHCRHTLDPKVAAELARRSAGNPFYALEMARFLDIEADPGASLEALERSLPRGLQPLVAARLGSLSSAARQMLRTAATLSSSIDPELLALVEPGSHVSQSVEEACAAGILIELEQDEKTLAFSHDLIREAIYAQLALRPEECRRTHLRIAEAMLARATQRPIETAYHLAAAAPLGGLTRTVEALRRAGDHARSVFDDEHAWDLYLKALQMLEGASDPDDATRFELLTSAGEIGIRGPRIDVARGLLREALEIARSRGRVEPFCRACLVYGYRAEIVGTSEDEIVDLLEEALELLGGAAPSLRARLLSRLAIEVRYRPDPGLERSLSLLEDAIEIARSAADPLALARTLEDASGIRWSVEDPEGWIALNGKIVRAAAQAGDVDLQFRGVKGLATGYMEVGDRPSMEREIRHCHDMAAGWPTPYLRGVSTSLRGAQAMLEGRFAEGEAYALEVLKTGIPGLAPLASVQLFYHRLELDRLGELEAATRSLAESLPGVSGWRLAIVRLLVSMERHDEAIAEIQRIGSLDNLPRDRNWLPAMALYAEVLPVLGDEANTAAHFARLRPYARVNVVLGNGSLFYGNVAYFLGLLATSLGRWTEADQMLDAAESMHVQLASRPWITRVGIARARLRSECGDRDGARTLLERYAPEADSLGMIALAKQAAAIRARL